MIIIPRREGQGVVIGDEVIVTVVEVHDDRVTLAVEYPDDGSVEEGEDRSWIRIYRDVELSVLSS